MLNPEAKQLEVQQRDLMKAISKKENDLDKMQDALEKTEKKTKEKVKLSRLQNKLRGFDFQNLLLSCLAFGAKSRRHAIRRVIYLQGWAIGWALGCVNPASWLPLAAGASSRNPGPTF